MDDNVGAALGKQLGMRATHATARAGDEGDFAGELAHFGIVSLLRGGGGNAILATLPGGLKCN
jgi:hypothetical protein